MDEYFGTPDQQAIQRRSEALWTLLKDDPRYCSYGRTVTLATYDPADLDRHIALTRAQGATPGYGVPTAALPALRAGLEAAGLTVDVFREWTASDFAAADRVLAERQLPHDLTLREIGPDAAPQDLRQVDALTRGCGVLMPSGRFLRGEFGPACCLVAVDLMGRYVGATATFGLFHRDSPRAAQAWWGMLATAEDRRGAGIALVLGAHSMRAARDRFAMASVFTGVRKGNAASEAICAHLGLAWQGDHFVVAADPVALAGGRLTA